jgi:hypothetical protein
MTNDEIPNDERSPNVEIRKRLDPFLGRRATILRHSGFGIRISLNIGYFVIRHFIPATLFLICPYLSASLVKPLIRREPDPTTCP